MKLTLSDREGFAAFLLRARGAGIGDAALFSALESIPRRAFVPHAHAGVAYGARSIPIECGETLEALDLQARMIGALQLEPKHRVLEIGTGSGYSTAVMARMAGRVVSVERYRRLVEAARLRIEQLQLKNVIVRHGDATTPDSEDGSYDRVISWVAFETLPRNFVDLVSSQGIMVCPVGPTETLQRIARLQKTGSRFERDDIGEGRFTVIAGGLPVIL
jgi:protein-L-isoaspartate(D-aspartate) O-methyltransferase